MPIHERWIVLSQVGLPCTNIASTLIIFVSSHRIKSAWLRCNVTTWTNRIDFGAYQVDCTWHPMLTFCTHIIQSMQHFIGRARREECKMLPSHIDNLCKCTSELTALYTNTRNLTFLKHQAKELTHRQPKLFYSCCHHWFRIPSRQSWHSCLPLCRCYHCCYCCMRLTLVVTPRIWRRVRDFRLNIVICSWLLWRDWLLRHLPGALNQNAVRPPFRFSATDLNLLVVLHDQLCKQAEVTAKVWLSSVQQHAGTSLLRQGDLGDVRPFKNIKWPFMK